MLTEKQKWLNVLKHIAFPIVLTPSKPRMPPAVKPIETDHFGYCMRRAFNQARASSYCAGMQEVCNRFVVDRAFGEGHYYDLELCLEFAAENCAPPYVLDRQQLLKECPEIKR